MHIAEEANLYKYCCITIKISNNRRLKTEIFYIETQRKTRCFYKKVFIFINVILIMKFQKRCVVLLMKCKCIYYDNCEKYYS